jgi:hypothetical protein
MLNTARGSYGAASSTRALVKRFVYLSLLAGVALLSSIPARARAQTADSTRSAAVRVFLDCQRSGCDFDYFRTEIKFVNWVRDRQVADVHLFVTTQETGAGGTSYSLNFIGLQGAAGMTDSLMHVSRQTDTDDDVRKALAKVIKLGLMRFVARSPAASQIQITYTAPDSATTARKTKDPWNYWVFRTGASGNFNGEKSSGRNSVNGSLSANRTTEAWRISLSANGNYSASSFTFDTTTSYFYSHSYGANGLVVKSMGPHWSSGVNSGFSSSTRQNQKLQAYVGPSVEYDIFPYKQSTRRMFTLRYTLNASTVSYDEETIYDKTSEQLLQQSLEASLSVRQPWGSISTSLAGSHYLHDASKWQSNLFTSFDVRVFKGFSVNMFGSVQLIRDQLYLPKAGASHDDVLLQRRQLETGYSYFVGAGLSYTFGSIFNDIVNPRFGGGGGGSFFFSF